MVRYLVFRHFPLTNDTILAVEEPVLQAARVCYATCSLIATDLWQTSVLPSRPHNYIIRRRVTSRLPRLIGAHSCVWCLLELAEEAATLVIFCCLVCLLGLDHHIKYYNSKYKFN